MPYITGRRREALDPIIDCAREAGALSPGDLAYIFYRLLLQRVDDTFNYLTLTECIGVLETVKLWLFHDIAVPYEEKKRRDNGKLPEEMEEPKWKVN